MKFCPNCGAKLPRPGEDQFCMNCGAKIPTIPMEERAESPVPDAPATGEKPAGEAAAKPQPRGEDLLNMIEEVQHQGALPPSDAAAADGAPSLFADAPVLTGGGGAAPAASPADNLFASEKPPASQPNMFSTAVMQSVKPPPQGASSTTGGAGHPQPGARNAQRPAPAPAPKQAPPRQGQPDVYKAAPAPADLFSASASAGAESLFDTPVEGGATIPDAPPRQPSSDNADLFDTASMLAASDEDAALFQRSARPAARRAPARGDTHSHTAQRPRAVKQAGPRPMRQQTLEDLDSVQSAQSVAKAQRPAPMPVLPEPPQEIKKSSAIGRVLTAFAVLIIFLVVCACTILAMLYFRNRPAQTIDDFAEAVAAVDIAKLNKLTALEGVQPDEAQWQAFCGAFSQSAQLNELKSQLLMMSEGAQNVDYPYPAVTIQSEPFILFIDRYKVKVQAVSLIAPGAADGTKVMLNTAEYSGTLQGDGVRYDNLMPGHYQCRVLPPGVLPENAPPVDITIFAVAEPNYLNGEAPKVDIVISNCVSDDAILYVNDQPVAEQPVGGVVTIPHVALGSTIRISAIQDGVTMEASLVFSDLNTATQLAFADYTRQGEPAAAESEAAGTDAAPTADALNAVLGTFYQSYLECINNQKIDGIQNTTTAANTALETRIKSGSNAGNLFQFTGVAVDAESIKTTTSGDLPAVQFNAKFSFSHKPREGEKDYEASSNYQTVEMVLQDGKWLVNKLTFVSEGDFNKHTLAAFD